MKTGIVLEGGACRGVFTTGVLDVMLERGQRFDYCVGVSAGAGNAMNYKSEQHGRAFEIVAGTGGMSYYGLEAAKRSGKLLDLDIVYHTMSYEGKAPFDFAAYYRNPMECEYVLTCLEDGKPAYFSEEKAYQDRLLEIVKASCSMPGLCSVVTLDGKHYLDGGLSDPMPVEHALEKGCDRVVLVTTKPPKELHPTDYSKRKRILHRLYGRRYPEFYEVLMGRIPMYFEQLGRIHRLEQEGKVLILHPEHCEVKALEKDRGKMQEYYAHGREVCEQNWEKLQNFLRE